MNREPSTPGGYFSREAHVRLRRAAATLVALLCVAASVPAAAQFRKGPHLQDLRTDGVTVIWEQEVAGPGRVLAGGVVVHSPSATLHRVRVAGLQPGTEYDYVVEAEGRAEAGRFRTAPADPLASFAFIVAGDNRSGPAAHQQVIDAVLAEGPVAFLVNTGDMVSSGKVAADWQSFFEIERPLIRSLPWYPTIGNHEEDEGKLPRFYTDFLSPPSESSGRPEYYSFTYANSAFLVLDSHVRVESLLSVSDFDKPQKNWLEATLQRYRADSAIQHIFVFVHEPPYSSKEGRSGSRAVRQILPTLARFGVDALITGHDHYLERGESPSGVRYWVMGGGGAPLYANKNEGRPGYKIATALPWLDDARTVHFAKSAHGYMRVEVHNGQVVASVRDVYGAVLDSHSWNTGDVSRPDAGVPDAGTPDAATHDAGADGGSEDGGGSDDGGGDAGAADAAVDAGEERDGGSLGETDAGAEGDGGENPGVPDGGPPDDDDPLAPAEPGCSCGSAPGTLALGAVLLALVRRPRRAPTRPRPA